MRWNNGASARSILAPTLVAGLVLCIQVILFGQSPQTQATPPQASPNQSPAKEVSPQLVQPTSRGLLVMIDPAHGGAEAGALLNPAMPEKDVNLVLARRLREELRARGLQAVLVRDGDATLSTDQRAAMANSMGPALFISVHSTSQGSGMRVYTAMLPVGGDSRGRFADWQTAQSTSLSRSRLLQDQIFTAIQKTGFPVRMLPAPLRPLNNVTAPAIAVELAPTTKEISQLAATDYQQMVCSALANAVAVGLSSTRPKAAPAP